MSFRGRGAPRGAPRGAGGFRGGGRGGSRGGASAGRFAPEEPPQSVVELGVFMHACEGELVCRNTNEKVREEPRASTSLKLPHSRTPLHARTTLYPTQIPYFNGGVFLQNKTQIGRVDEIFGATTANMFTVKPMDGVKADSFQAGDKVYVDPYKLLPMSRFTAPPPARGGGGAGRGGARGGAPGGFRGRGAPFRGGSPARGGFVSRGGGAGFAPRGGFVSRGRGQ